MINKTKLPMGIVMSTSHTQLALSAQNVFFAMPGEMKQHEMAEIDIKGHPKWRGGGENPPPVFRGCDKMVVRSPTDFFTYLISHPFHIFPENFVPRSSQVRSPSQVN